MKSRREIFVTLPLLVGGLVLAISWLLSPVASETAAQKTGDERAAGGRIELLRWKQDRIANEAFGEWISGGETVTYRAIPNRGYRFSHWVLDGQKYYPGYSAGSIQVGSDTITFPVERPVNLSGFFKRGT